MGRDYGRVGGKRSGSAAWQWLFIGLLVGMGCSAVIVLSLLTAGILAIDEEGDTAAFAPTPAPLIVTATIDALQAPPAT